MRQLTLGVQLKERATFASFLTARNQELVTHLQQLAATTPGGATWLAGPHTAGKSHLLQAVCAAVAPGRRAAYLPLEALLPFGPGTLDGAESLDVACFDDVQVVAGLGDWERRLFSLWQAALERHGTLLFAARETPAHVAFDLPDLKSRLGSSVIFAVRELNDDEQLQALDLRARLRGIELPAETARYLQRRFPRDMRTLCEILDTLDDAAFAAQRRLTVPFIRAVIEGRSGN
ncbi:MAG TPA: DnaA regulatory inactivator Hda [Steroidobacteraceae bacterium]|nr:DnaA regulatory inactivator Hda [Steroidobacteraceae bacterium]